MIKRYLQYINENSKSNSDLLKNLEEIPSLETIIDDVLINFMEDNDLSLVTKIDGINHPYVNNDVEIIKTKKDLKSIFKNIFFHDDTSILEYGYEYSYGYRICFVKNDQDYILTKENISYLNKIINNFYHNLSFISRLEIKNNYYFIVGKSVTFTDKEILDYYEVYDYKQDSKGVYVEVLASYVADLVLENKCRYKPYFTSTDDVWDVYYRYDKIDINNYLNMNNKEILNKLNDDDVKTEIAELIESYEMDAYIEEFLEDVWGDFLNKLRNNLDLKVELVKGKYYPFTHDDIKNDEATKLKIYYVNHFPTDSEYLENHFRSEKLSTIIDNFFGECETYSLSPIFSGIYHGRVDLKKLNKDVSDILQKV